MLGKEKPVISWKQLPGAEDGALYWNTVPGAAGYEVSRSEEREGVYEKCAEIGEIDRFYFVPVPMRKRWYKVRAYSEAKQNLGSWSDVVWPESQTGDMPASEQEMRKPRILCCAPDAKGGIRIYWTGDDRAAGWRIYRVRDGAAEVIEEILHLCTWEYRDKLGTEDLETEYCLEALYRLEGDILGESGLSEPCGLRETFSGGLRIAKFIPEGVLLRWNEVEGAGRYRLYRKDGVRAAYMPIGEIQADGELSYLDETAPGGTVRYILQAVTSGGSLACRPLKCEVPGKLERPKGLTVSAGAGGCAELLWDAMEGVSGFHIRRCTRDDRKGELAAEVPGDVTWWTDGGGAAYGYRVEAFLETGKGTAYSGYCKMAVVEREDKNG